MSKLPTIALVYNPRELTPDELDAVEQSHPGDIRRWHPKRQIASRNARLALQDCLREHSIHAPMRTLSLTPDYRLAQYPHWRVSLAHTLDWAIAMILPHLECKGIGIDIERQDRILSEQSQHLFINDEDRLSPSLLECWCRKEAAYKALSSSGVDVHGLTDIVIDGNHFHCRDHHSIFGCTEIQPRRDQGQDLLIAMAYADTDC